MIWTKHTLNIINNFSFKLFVAIIRKEWDDWKWRVRKIRETKCWSNSFNYTVVANNRSLGSVLITRCRHEWLLSRSTVATASYYPGDALAKWRIYRVYDAHPVRGTLLFRLQNGIIRDRLRPNKSRSPFINTFSVIRTRCLEIGAKRGYIVLYRYI